MKVLLTGASGFVGSHILDALARSGVPCAILIRQGSSAGWIEPHLKTVEIHRCGLGSDTPWPTVLNGVTHIVHCAGATRAVHDRDYFTGNRDVTASLAAAVQAHPAVVRRWIHISSLAAVGPATSLKPALETDDPHPVSVYGESKLSAERVVRELKGVDWTILRPPAVYGPRDSEFLRLFKAAGNGFAPQFDGGAQELSLVYVEDLADVVARVLDHPGAVGRVYHVASPEVITAGELTDRVARALGKRCRTLSIPGSVLFPVCAASQFWSRLIGKPTLLNIQKYAELRAPGWVCDPTQLRVELGIECRTNAADGMARTAVWYRQHGRLR